jgi:hypothetical protein
MRNDLVLFLIFVATMLLIFFSPVVVLKVRGIERAFPVCYLNILSSFIFMQSLHKISKGDGEGEAELCVAFIITVIVFVLGILG